MAFYQHINTILLSFGGTVGVLVLFSQWFGKIIANRLLANYNHKHEKELADLTAKYNEGLENVKAELDKAKAKDFRYSERQFELYNSIWKVLYYTKKQADDLWEKVQPDMIRAFGEQIVQAKSVIEENVLLIEEIHYQQLIYLIGHFELYKLGKTEITLKEFRKRLDVEANMDDAKKLVRDNKKIKNKYDALMAELRSSFRRQIQG